MDLIAFIMKLVVAEFVLYPQKDQEAASQSYRKPEEIEERVGFLLPEKTQGGS
jgi:hypothetical protein